MNPDTKSRWREDKMLTVSSYLPGDGRDRKPEPLVTTHVATARDERWGRYGATRAAYLN